MQSIFTAMTWEILKRGRWSIPAATLGAIAFPTTILLALQHTGALDPRDKSMLIMNVVIMLMSVMAFCSGLHPALGRMSRLYAYPARTSTLVVWRLMPAMVIIALQMALSIAIINFMFRVNWPLGGPVLFAPVALAVVVAAGWLAEKSTGWVVLLMTMVAAVLGLWLKSRYGDTFADPSHFWDRLTALEVIVMLAMAAAAYLVAVKAVARNRRGDPPLSTGFVDWLNALFESPARDVRFTTPFKAQCHVEWRRKGWMMPMAVFILIICGLIAWLVGSRSADDLFIGFLMGGYSLYLIGFIGGLLMGNTGPTDADSAIGHFLATRPISDAELGRAMLRTAAQSVFLAWAIWAVGFMIVRGCLWAAGWSAGTVLPDELHWKYFPATLLGPWIIVGTLMSLTLMGRPKILVQLACVLPAAIIAIILFSTFMLTREAQLLVERTLAVVATIAIVVSSAWVFFAARRRRLIQLPTVWAAATVWIVTTVIVAFQLPEAANQQWLAYLFVVAVVSLIVAPVAAVPLALSWNRHR